MDMSCVTCDNLIFNYPFYWCGLMRTENSDADVTFDWKPLSTQPEWCPLRKKDE